LSSENKKLTDSEVLVLDEGQPSLELEKTCPSIEKHYVLAVVDNEQPAPLLQKASPSVKKVIVPDN